jgi:hypothetical protein
MISPTLLEIDRSIRGLSLEEQMWLLERIVRHLREKTHTDAFPLNSQNMEEDLAAMASDPDIQAEIAAISQATWVFPQKKADCLWKQFSYVFKYAL